MSAGIDQVHKVLISAPSWLTVGGGGRAIGLDPSAVFLVPGGFSTSLESVIGRTPGPSRSLRIQSVLVFGCGGEGGMRKDGSRDTGKINQTLPFQVSESDSRSSPPHPPTRTGWWRCEVDTDVTPEGWAFFSHLPEKEKRKKDKFLAGEAL